MNFGELNKNLKHHEVHKPFSFVDRIKSFKHGFVGIANILKTEHNAWVHAVISIVVILLAWWLGLDAIRWSLILVAVAAVWAAEAFNTVIEMLVDIVEPTYTPQAKRAKDVAAAAVLITSVGSAILGIIILGPPLMEAVEPFIDLIINYFD